MFDFEYIKPFAIIDGVKYDVYHYDRCASNSVVMYLRNEQYEWATTCIIDETIINGVLQTSVDMILDTLTNG